MKVLIQIFLLFLINNIFGQDKTPEDFGFKHIIVEYKSDKVDVLIQSKKGEEHIKKPLFFFCQGSLPQPLIKYDTQGVYGVFPFDTASLCEKYHLVIVSKPSIPIICEVKNLGANYTYIDSTGHFPKNYTERNLPDYYTYRNIAVLKYLRKQSWVSNKQLVVAGHSEGSTIAAKMANKSSSVTHLIYSGGNPMGRIMSMIQQNRANETDTEGNRFGEDEIKYWQYVVENKTNSDGSQGDTPKATFEFSNPPIDDLEKLKIPILVCYGTKDWSSPFNDFLRVDMIRKGKKNFTYKTYIGTEHNYFPIDASNKPNYEVFNWDKVANDWLLWLK